MRSTQSAFFQHDGHPYWTVLIEYEPLLAEEERRPHEPDLPEERRHLLARLQEWRKERAERDGVPVFLVATNAQLLEVARRAPTTLEALRQINGFGRKKVERYGKALTGLIDAFLGGDSGGEDASPARSRDETAAAGKTQNPPEPRQTPDPS